MDIKLVNPFLEATVNVLNTMAFTEATAGKPYLKKKKEASGDVTGTIGFHRGRHGRTGDYLYRIMHYGYPQQHVR